MYRKIVVLHLLHDSQSFRTKALACQALLRNTKRKILATNIPCHIPLQYPDRALQVCPKLSTLLPTALRSERHPKWRVPLRTYAKPYCLQLVQPNVADASQGVIFPHLPLPLPPYQTVLRQSQPTRAQCPGPCHQSHASRRSRDESSSSPCQCP